jgi:hypothetical protein
MQLGTDLTQDEAMALEKVGFLLFKKPRVP